MANPNPYKFSIAEQSQGGKAAGVKRLNTNIINKQLTDYIASTGEFDGNGFIEDMKDLKPRERIWFLIQYLPYERPKLQAIQQIVDITERKMSKEDRTARIVEIVQDMEKST